MFDCIIIYWINFIFIPFILQFYEQKDSLTGLKEWTKVNHEWMTFGVRHFKVFLPEGQIELGSIYRLYSDDKSFLSLSLPHLSSNRFYPSKVDDKLIILYRILAMFHPRPFLISRFPPQGGVAMVRAYNDDYIEIVFRYVFIISLQIFMKINVQNLYIDTIKFTIF